MARTHRRTLAVVLLLTLVSPELEAATVDFSSVSIAQVSSPAGQNFPYVLGAGPANGTLNVRVISGDISNLTIGGGGPDAHALYVLQVGALTPVRFRFQFDQPRSFQVTSNETLTALETNTFSYATAGNPWIVLTSSHATVTNTGSEVSFVGVNISSPYGQFSVAGGASSFDFLVSNAPGFSVYGSAISLNIIDETTATTDVSWGHLKRLYR